MRLPVTVARFTGVPSASANSWRPTAVARYPIAWFPVLVTAAIDTEAEIADRRMTAAQYATGPLERGAISPRLCDAAAIHRNDRALTNQEATHHDCAVH
jgi:hypothetical protein